MAATSAVGAAVLALQLRLTLCGRLVIGLVAKPVLEFATARNMARYAEVVQLFALYYVLLA